MLVIANHTQLMDGGKVLQGCYIVAKSDLTGLINHHGLDGVGTSEDVDEIVGEHRDGAEDHGHTLSLTGAPLEFAGGDDVLEELPVEMLMPA